MSPLAYLLHSASNDLHLKMEPHAAYNYPLGLFKTSKKVTQL